MTQPPEQPPRDHEPLEPSWGPEDDSHPARSRAVAPRLGDPRDRPGTGRLHCPFRRSTGPGSAARFPLSPEELAALVRMALEEDGAFNDVTTIATVVTARRARGAIVARRAGTVAGVTLALEAFRQLDPKAVMRVIASDGESVAAGEPVVFIRGHARGMLSAERVALNFMQHLSGIATLTTQFVAAVRGTGAKILDTRKTLPGWRALEKYAVRCGGGQNHRMDLASAVLIKDNHLAAVDGDVGLAISRARKVAPAARPHRGGV